MARRHIPPYTSEDGGEEKYQIVHRKVVTADVSHVPPHCLGP